MPLLRNGAAAVARVGDLHGSRGQMRSVGGAALKAFGDAPSIRCDEVSARFPARSTAGRVVVRAFVMTAPAVVTFARGAMSAR